MPPGTPNETGGGVREPTRIRELAPLPEGQTRKLKRLPIPPPPKIAWIPLSQLRIDGDYQRNLSDRSTTLIRKMVETWDWNSFKPLSVAATGDGVYEIVDGQHTAIAAVTHGSIETLPCLVLDASTRALRAKAFVGINADRIALTPYALYRARLAAGDVEAEAVDAALAQSGATLLERMVPSDENVAGSCAIVSSLLQIVRRGGRPRLARLLKIAVAGGAGPIPSVLLKALEIITTSKGIHPSDDELAAVLRETDVESLADEARAYRRTSLANGAEAWAHLILQRAGFLNQEAA